ncbi:alpha-amylase 1-like [Prorops nasuta]|uniref:alpha-amylase 1-like n=1 Tax=Prorops nasuta TaxID=863751 RepID=UPI0034D01E70
MLLIVNVSLLLSAVIAYKNPHYVPGHNTMVHLFEWKWLDIAEECEQFLGPMGYGGVQVSPIQENIIIPTRPWYERYQPISYKWKTRSGNEEEFREMVERCNKAGVRIYVDAVVNHMTGNHEQEIGTGNSTADTKNRQYWSVPFSPDHFNSLCAITNFSNPYNVRNCELVGLHDLNQTNEHVRETIVAFMNEAIDAGVAGFRIDAAKHMWPQDLGVIYSRLKNLNTNYGFPKNSRPFIFQEVIDPGHEAISKYEYNNLGAVTEFRYGIEMSKSFRGYNSLKWFINWGEAWSLLPSKDSFVFIDNHDTQRSGDFILTHKSSKLYKMAVALMLAHPYGIPRVMSSFAFESFNNGPPADAAGNIISPIIYKDNTCGNGWVCEHRWRQIYNMVRFRNAVNGTNQNSWWENGNNQIAFCRGDSGFIAINAEHSDLKTTFTNFCMPPGVYCDVISGNLENGECTGKTVTVNPDRTAYVEILTSEEDGVLALHRNARL